MPHSPTPSPICDRRHIPANSQSQLASLFVTGWTRKCHALTGTAVTVESLAIVDTQTTHPIEPTSVMVLIRDLSQQALAIGYLTIESENQLRRMLTTTKYDLEDLNAFMTLQLAAMSGLVKQESRELREGRSFSQTASETST